MTEWWQITLFLVGCVLVSRAGWIEGSRIVKPPSEGSINQR